MESDTEVTTSSVTSSTPAISEATTEKREQVDPRIVADLQTCEYCDVKTLLGVLLKRCSLSGQMPPAQNLSGPQMSTGNIPDGSPDSSATVRASEPALHTGSPNLNSESGPSSPPAQDELLQHCLELVLPKCKNTELLSLMEVFRNSGKEHSRYIPMAKLLITHCNS
ncbi:unnamed protein product [Rhizoctonia solani]|uniref:Uncharacterized protein n=1 Tax=Rhizoctonia solani TaxID=456999 RepID=A0A8H3I056_9AGAM|nr:unnamed protein product [Rhizoctonia solani]